MKNFVIALQFLTRITLNKELEVNDRALAESAKYFLLIGILIGLFLVAVDWLFSFIFPPTVVNVLILISLIWVTGAIHLDGFMDSIDGLFGGKTKKESLAIMRDSKIGSFGIIAAICLFLLKFVLLQELSGSIRVSALILMPVLGRWAMVCAMPLSPYARKKGKASFTGLVNVKTVVIASIVMFGSAFILLKPINVLLVLVSAFFFMLLITQFVKKKIGGMTGDTYGALNEVIEVVVLIVFVLMKGVLV